MNDFPWVANKKAIGHCSKPFAIYPGQQMMCHLFLKKNLLTIRHRSGQLGNDFPPIGFAGRNDLLTAGMFYARGFEVISIKWLIDNDSIVPITP